MSEVLKNLFAFIEKLLQKANRVKKWIAFVAFFMILYRMRHRKHDNIPMLPGWTRWRGHIPFFKKHFNVDLNESIYELVKRANFPKISVVNAYRMHAVLVIDPDILKFIWCTEFSKFKKGERIQHELSEMLGDGIFTSDPPKWQLHRKVASRMFSMRNLKDYMFECTISHTKQVIDKINSNDEFLQDIDIYNMLARYTLDCFTSIAFGKSIDSVSIYPSSHPFAEAFDEMMHCFVVRHFTFDFMWKPIRMLPYPLTIGNEYLIKKNTKVIDKFADDVLNKRQKTMANITDEFGDKYNDIISLFMKHDKTLTKEQLKYIAMNMIIAGRDTTRLLLSWFLYEMCLDKNTNIKLKIYEEINQYLLDNKSKEMEYDKIKDNLLYLESALLETLRLNPAVPFLVRYAMEDVKLPNGHIMRKGDEIIIPTWTFARNPNIYKDPLKFDPDRFYNKKQDPLNVYDVYRYPFFNTNPRLCLGRTLALMESKVFIFYFFQQYDFEMVHKNQEIKIKTGLVLNMVNGLRLKLTKK